MPTTFNWIYLGTFTTALDPTEGNDVAENANLFVGQTYGSTGSPLYNSITSVTTINNGGNATALDMNNSVVNDQFTTNIGSGPVTYTMDATAIYNATITYANGTTAVITAVVVQSTTGEFFLAPEFSSNPDTAAQEAMPIVSIRLDSVNGNTFSGLTSDRLMTGFDNAIVDGTAGADLINASYVEPLVSGTDRIDNGDGGVGVGANDDYVLARDGNDTVFSGVGNDTVYGGNGNDQVNGEAGNDQLYGDAGNDSLVGDVGNDSLYGGVGLDSLFGGNDNDLAYGGSENDLIYGGAGLDTLYGDDGDDTLYGGDGNDTLVGGIGLDQLFGDAGDDSLVGDAGNDSLYGGIGLDSLYGGADNDLLSGGSDNDLLYGGLGLDTLNGDLGNDTLYGDAGNDSLNGGDGDDSLYGGDDNDTLVGGIGFDQLYGDAGNDSLIGDAGNDGLYGGLGDDTLSGDDGADWIDSGDGNDLIYGGTGNDTIAYGTGNDTIYGGDGNDLIDDISGQQYTGFDQVFGGTGNDTIWTGSDADTVYGGADNDQISGEDGNDLLFGDDGFDTLYGGNGADILDGGDGPDFIDGGADQDTIIGGLGDTVTGGGTGLDEDTLDLTAWGKANTNIIFDPNNRENGTVEFLDSNGVVVGTLTFTDIETVVPCFTPGTQILTAFGARPVESLEVGDLVLTRDNGLQPIRWVGRRDLSFAELLLRPSLRPVSIKAGAMGNSSPDRDMLVSPQHRMLFEGARAEMLFGEREVLIAAAHLAGRSGIEQKLTHGVSYIHVMFDQHEIIHSDGCWSESFQPGAAVLSGMRDAQREELIELFPELASNPVSYSAARPSLKKHEVRVLMVA